MQLSATSWVIRYDGYTDKADYLPGHEW